MFLVNKYLFIKIYNENKSPFKGDLFYLKVMYVIHTSTIKIVELIHTI